MVALSFKADILGTIEGNGPGGDGLPTVGTPFTTDLVISDADHGKRYEWNGTVARRVTVPSGLSEGVTVEIVAQSTTANLAQLTVERASANDVRRKGSPTGGRLLRPGGRVLIRKEAEASVRIEGDLDPAPMAAQNGGASFLLERGLRQTQAGSNLLAWGDKYGLNDFGILNGTPTVGELGEMISLSTGGADVNVEADPVQYAGTGTLLGIAFKINSITVPTGSSPTLVDFSAPTGGRGIYLGVTGGASVTSFNLRVLRGANNVFTAFSQAFRLGLPVALAVAVFHPVNVATGYIVGFCDEGYVDREKQFLATGVNHVVDWTTTTLGFNFGPIFGTADVLDAAWYAVNMRDNLTFANINDARDQAAAMLTEMRGYV